MESQIPAELKKCSCFLNVGAKLEESKPIVAYALITQAVETGIQILQQVPANRKAIVEEFLTKILDGVESVKSSLQVTEQQAKASLEEYSVQMFDEAQLLDSQGEVSKMLITKYYVAGVCFRAWEQFGTMDEHVVARTQYCTGKMNELGTKVRSGQVNHVVSPAPEIRAPSHASSGNGSGFLASAGTPSGSTPVAPRPVAPPTSAPPPPMYNPAYMSPPGLPPPVHSSSISGRTPDVHPPVVTPTPSVSSSSSSSTSTYVPNAGGRGVDEITEALKYAKFAVSSLQFQDVGPAIENLEKALRLLRG